MLHHDRLSQANFWIRDVTSARRHVLYNVQFTTRIGSVLPREYCALCYNNYYFNRGRGAGYCDENVCLWVVLSVHKHIWGTTHPNFTKFSSVLVAFGHDSVLLWQRCNTLCTSGFVDDVIFSCDGASGGVSLPYSSVTAASSCMSYRRYCVFGCVLSWRHSAKSRRVLSARGRLAEPVMRNCRVLVYNDNDKR